MNSSGDKSFNAHRAIWQLAWPMLISNISQPLLGMVDTAILGHLQQPSFLGAVAVGSSLLAFVYWGFGFLRMGTTGLVAQSVGRGDETAAARLLIQSVILALLIACLVILFSPWLLPLALNWMDASQTLSPLALSYSQIRLFSAPAVLCTYTLIGWCIGRQNTRAALYIMLSTNCLNIVLDCVFILVLGMKSDGAAWATVISEYVGLAIGLLIILQYRIHFPDSWFNKDLYRWRDFKKLLVVNQHLFVRTVCLLFCFAFFTAQGAQQSDTVLAANSVLMQLLMLTAFGLDGFAHAIEALSGDAIGGKKLSQFYIAVRAAAFWSLVTALGFTALFFFGQAQLPLLFTDIDPVLTHIRRYYPWLVVLPIVAVWSYLFDGVFVGTTRSKAMRDTMLFSCLLVYLPAWYFSQGWGNHGLWFAFTAFSLSRSASMAACFYWYSRTRQWTVN